MKKKADSALAIVKALEELRAVRLDITNGLLKYFFDSDQIGDLQKRARAYLKRRRKP